MKIRKRTLLAILLCINLLLLCIPVSNPVSAAGTPVSIAATYLGGKNGKVSQYTYLSKSDFIVVAYYSDGSTEIVTDFTYSPSYINTLGTNVITIKYKNLTTTYNVECVNYDLQEKYYIIFNSMGGTYVESLYNIEADSSVILPVAPSRYGYWFRGWYTDVSYSNEFTESTLVTSNLTLYAKWETKQNNGKDTLAKVVTDGNTSFTIAVDLTGKEFLPSAALIAYGISQDKVSKAAANIAKTKKYIGFELDMVDFAMSPKNPLSVSLFLPDNYDPGKSAVYYCPDKSTNMGKMTGYLNNKVINFEAYGTGTYILIECIDEPSPTMPPGEEPYIELKNPGTIAINQQTALYLRFENFTSTDDLTNFYYKSSNTSIASIDKRGIITGKGVGRALITCTSTDRNYSDSVYVKVVVSGPLIKSIKPNITGRTMTKGSTFQLKVTISPKNATLKTLTYQSSNSSVASVTSTGKISAKKKGTCYVTVKTKDGSSLSKRIKIVVK